MKGWVTINTDAGWFQIQKVGSYAYWIKADGLHLHGSGMLKGTVNSSTNAERMAIANALHILKCSEYTGITKIVFNRDNINAKGRKDGGKVEKLIHELIKYFYDKMPYPKCKLKKFYEFRHVKAHSDGKEKRDWVNQWLDQRCKERLREWLKANPYTINKK